MSQIQLNEEQTLAVRHPVGQPACLIAGAGSGKTRVLTERVRWLMENGVPPRRIVAITFTNKAAAELVERLGIGDHTPRDLQPRVSTIHSLSLSAIRRNPLGFGLQEKVSPLDDYDQYQMMKKIIERVKSDENPKRVLEAISFHRARGYGFAVDYTAEVHRVAEQMHGGYHALDQTQLGLWKLYEVEKTKNSVVDFDDMLHLVLRRAETDPVWKSKLERMYEFVLMDEAQDTNPTQWKFVNLLLAQDNPNLYVVGDMSQCQPPGTRITVVTEPPRGAYPAKLVQKNIEDLVDGDLAGNIWCKHDQYTYSAGRKIRVAKRQYAGPMLRIVCNGNSTRVTPNHWLWVRFNKSCVGKYLVYLMYRSDLGFRVGLTKFKNATANGYGLSYRMAQEKADKGWILRVCDTRAEAESWEEIYAIKYGIPECCFDPEGCLNRKAEHIRLVFSYANPQGGRRCLEDHNLLEEFPIAVRNSGIENGHRAYNQSWRGYFKCAAANLLPTFMEIPQVRRNSSAPISAITREPYSGWVYSLDVEKDHTYEADGIIVGNSIYGFNGAVPQILKDYSDEWRGLHPVMYKIARNHRSVPEIVSLANAIQRKMTRTIPLRMESWRGMQGDKGVTKTLKACMASDISQAIAHEIHHSNTLKGDRHIAYKDNAILVRSAMQIRDIEGALVRLRIPYIVRGGRGLLQTEEVRDVLSYLRLATNVKDFMAMVRAVSVPRRGIGDVALEKIREYADKYCDGDLLKALVNNPKLSQFLQIINIIRESENDPCKALKDCLQLSGYRKYITEKYNKKGEQEKAAQKEDNLQRFALMVQGLVEENTDLTLSDLVFQLSIDRQDTTDESGKVIISTIHSAKGLEWKRVYVSNINEGSLPHKFSVGNEEEVEEERRLFYVACTRARDILVLCIPGMEQRGPNVYTLTPSRFLAEIGIS